jgi:signal transduction histidine kinase
MIRLKRRTNYVDSSVQGALLRKIFTHWIVFFFATGLSVVVLQTLLGDPSKSLGERLQMEMGEFVFIGIVMVALLPAFMLDTVRFSNRFVGPILRLRRHLRELGQDQETDDCNFRDHDFWNEIAAEFNVVTDLVKSQRDEIAELKKQLDGSHSAV